MKLAGKIGIAILALATFGVGLFAMSDLTARPDPARAVEALGESLDAKGLTAGQPAFMRIFKEERVLELWLRAGEEFALFGTWPICAASGDLGPKLREGDGQSPEGFYFVTIDSLNPNSRFHLSFNLGFPNAYDRAHDRTGSFLMVHGDCVSIGCYAMTDGGIEEIYGLAEAALQSGQRFFRVHIFPFRMTDENMMRYADSPWAEFWANLKEGYDLFEATRRPPNVTVRDRRYIFDTMETST